MAKLMEAWTGVKVTKKKHPREGQAGVVQIGVNEGDAEVTVKFDVDGEIEAVSLDDITVLS